MTELFDLIIVGGGPVGLEAVLTAAHFGLKVALLQGLLAHMGRIEPERPELARKISLFRPGMVLQLIKLAARLGFPNR